MSVDQRVQQHYTHGALLAAAEDSLRALGKDPAQLRPEDLAEVDELHIGGHPATVGFISQCGFAGPMRILDVGSGLGGPARAFALATGAHVTGIDLTAEFVAVAQTLSDRVGLTDRTAFQQGSALDLPFEAASFDGAYMIHVGMNIEDKARLFKEVRQVLRPGATFGLYDIMQLSPGEMRFPVPWSSHPETSFVVQPGDYRAALEGAGFEITAERDRLDFARAFFDQVAARQASGTAPVQAHRGADFAVKARNLRDMIKAGLLGPREIIAKARA